MHLPVPRRTLRPSRSQKKSPRLRIETLEVRDVPAAFTPGDIVVERVGDGSAALSSAATAVFLDEYSPTGTLVQTIPLPTSDSGSNHIVTDSGSATSEGILTLSGDGQYLMAVGYDAAVGTASVVGTSSASTARVMARIGFDGVIDSSTTTTSFSANNIRSAVTTNGTDIWAVGANTGVVYSTLGGSGAGTVVSSNATNLRVVNVFNGQLYVSSGSGTNTFRGVNTVGSGTPTSTGNTTTRLPGLADSTNNSDYSFFFADLSPSVAGVDTLYIADDGAAALMKWSLVGGTWVSNGAIGTATDTYRGVTGVVNGSTVTLYATRTANQLVSFVDTSGYDGTLAGTPTVLATAASNTAFRSVVTAPAKSNSPPVNTLPSYTGANSATEDIVKVLNGISVADPDAGSANIQVTFQLSNGGSSFLTLKDGVAGGVNTGAGDTITGNGTGTVTVTASQSRIDATLADASGLTFTSPANFNSANNGGDVTITMTSNDLGNTGSGGPKSDVDSSSITVTPVADDPSVTASTTAEDTQSNDGGLVISRNAVDGSEVTNFQITNITNGTLYKNDGTSQINEGDFITFAEGNAGLKFTPAQDFNGDATFQIQASTSNSAAGLGGNKVTATIHVTEVNDPPIAVDDILPNIAEDSGDYTIAFTDLTSNDSPGPANESGQSLTITSLSNAVGGTVGLSGTTVTFSPTADFNGPASFDYVVQDNGTTNGSPDPQSATGTASFTITEVNDPPIAVDDSLPNIAEDSGDYTIPFSSLTSNDSPGPANESSQTLTIISVGNATGGTVSISGTNVIFSPTANYNGPASFDYVVQDNGTTNGSPDPLSDTGSVSFTITEVNDPPTAVNDSLPGIAEDSGDYTIATTDLTSNDSPGPADESGQTLTVISVSNAVGGTVSLSGTTVTFSPTADFNGPASFDYVVQDNGTTNGSPDPQSATGTASFTITEVNDPPIAVDDSLPNIAEDSGDYTIPFSSLTSNDSPGPSNESGQTLTIISVGNATGGTVSISGTNVIFSPTADYNGPASFDYVVQDDGTTNGAPDPKTDTGHVSFTITEVNDPPIAVDDSLSSVAEDSGPRTIPLGSLTINDSPGPLNESGQSLTVISVGTPVGGSVSLSGPNAIFIPAPNFYGLASFSYVVQDNGTTNGVSDPKTDTGVVTFLVTPVADTPSVTPASTFVDTQTTSGLQISRNPVDGSEVTYFKITNIQNGTLFLNDGTTPVVNGNFVAFSDASAGLKFTPTPGFFGLGHFDVQASLSNNDAGLGGSTATANITVIVLLHTPTATPATTNEDTQTTSGLVLTPNALDVGQATDFKITNIQNGTLFQHDGTTPIASGDFITVAQGAAGLKFTPSPNYFGGASFDLQPSASTTDAGLGGTVVTDTITVNPVADTPIVTGATTNEDTQTTSGLVLSRNAVDGTEVTSFKITNIQNGTLFQHDGITPIASGSFITVAQGNAGLKFTPAANYFGPASFDVQASIGNTDAGLGGSVVTANITVNPVADTPSVTGSSTNEDVETATGLVITRNPVDGSEVPFYKITNIQNGSLFENDGSTPILAGSFITIAQGSVGLKFLPSADYFGGASFDVQASLSNADAGLGGSVVTANISVSPVADTPSVSSTITNEDTQSTSGLVISRAPVDGSEVTNFKITSIQHGTLFLNDGVTAISNGEFITFAQGNAGLKFTPAPNYNGAASFGVQASLSNSDAGLGGSIFTANINVTSVNDAPVLDSTATPLLPYIPVAAKVPTAGPGAPLTTLTQNISDVDGPGKGIAISAVDDTKGKWQFETSVADGWHDITNVSTTHALLLANDSDTLIRFTPNKGFTGFSSFTFNAWDQSNGKTEGAFETDLGSSAYSTANDQAWVAVGKPKVTIDPDGATVLKPTLPVFKATSKAVALAPVMAKDLLGVIGLETTTVPKTGLGVAITAADSTSGHWEYKRLKLDTSFHPIALSAGQVLLLRPTDQLHFVPTLGSNGAAPLTFKTWDPTAGVGSAGLSNLSPTGTGFGVDTGRAVLDLTPVLDLSKPAILNPIDATHPPTPGTFSDFISASRVVGTNLGVAITATKGTGVWEYSTDGSTWTPVGKVSTGRALFLAVTDEIRFTPTSNTTPQTASLSFKAWDMTRLAVGSVGAASGTFVSKETEILTVAVADHQPALSPAPVAFTVKTAKASAGMTVKSLIGTSITDPDGVRALKGIAITAVDDSNGTWQYSLGRNVWVNITGVSASSALLLADTSKIRFIPATGYTGPATISYEAWDRTAGQAGESGVDTTGVLSTMFSVNTVTATFTVTM
jgi:Bacterial Ig domain